MSASKMFSGFLLFVMAVVVAGYLGVQSFNFFEFTFPPEQKIYAYLGFGLTGGGLIAYLAFLRWGVETELEKVIAVVMVVVCMIGELATAGFGMQVEAWRQAGQELTKDMLNVMINMIRLLAFAHAVALIMKFAGDRVLEVLGVSISLAIPVGKPVTNFQSPPVEHR